MTTHHVPQDKLDAAQAAGTIGAIMMLSPTCGARATVRGQLLMISDWDQVDCKRCLNRKPEPKPVNLITMFRLVWHGDHELRLEWDEDQYIRTNAVSITDEDAEVQAACQILIDQYFHMMSE